jgi:hypothetical protein
MREEAGLSGRSGKPDAGIDAFPESLAKGNIRLITTRGLAGAA